MVHLETKTSIFYFKEFRVLYRCIYNFIFRIELDFEHFELEHGTECSYDYLEIRERGVASGPLVGRFCGRDLPQPYISSSNMLYISFRSDYSISHSGFRIRYKTACGGEFSAPSGIIRLEIKINYLIIYQNIINYLIGLRITQQTIPSTDNASTEYQLSLVN